ncbi:peptidoglycan DD-metalloendopeptidase family protein [Synechococcales cyanobacterium C]|uniref:Peptidoglycan DD-metalloendopeptidase family protein n=1 Tax=Petrachloros mirabilis ULC683 TaxID=2781853 RepID=A0A8K1ZW23_9CYAN|nr:glycosyl hydrolase 108 family protein [Petrachloros mirabilis]NCJ05191.1 peptidoglycan DD-metalloendopeptidase family protein [Petrachloros mirabilis ULC683]
MLKLEILQPTFAKQSTAQSTQLLDHEKYFLADGEFAVHSWQVVRDHLRVALAEAVLDGRNTWYFYAPHCRLVGLNGQPLAGAGQPPTESNLPDGFKVPERQLSWPNYPVAQTRLGQITFTGGFMEPHGHSWKDVTRAIFADGVLRQLPPSNRNLGIDYCVGDKKIRAWYGGTVTKVGLEGGYGHRCHIHTNLTYRHQGQDYPLWTAYAHAQSFNVRVNDKILPGQEIGVEGGTGRLGRNDYPDHVDFRTWIHVGGQSVDVSPNAIEAQLRADAPAPDSAPAKTARSESEILELALAFTLHWEGGAVDHVDDLGGRTNRGITQGTYDRWRDQQGLHRQDVWLVSEAEATRIYREQYWVLGNLPQRAHPAFEIVHFDTCVMHGIVGGTIFLQELFNLKMDGILGPQTEAAVLRGNGMDSALRYCKNREAYRHQRVRENPSQQVFLQGWLNRDQDLARYIQEVVA